MLIQVYIHTGSASVRSLYLNIDTSQWTLSVECKLSQHGGSTPGDQKARAPRRRDHKARTDPESAHQNKPIRTKYRVCPGQTT